MISFQRYLFIVAHPDDETISSGGLISSLVAKGKDVKIVVATDGSTGVDHTGRFEKNITEVRSKELNLAAQKLGVSNVEQLDIPCQELFYTKENLHKIIGLIRGYKPDLIITHTEEEKHQDHINLSKIVKQSSWKASEDILPQLGKPHFTKDVWGFECVDPISDVDFLISVDEVSAKRKFEALACYNSQDNVINNIQQYVEGLLAVRGYQCGTKYAEAYKRINIQPMRFHEQ